MSVPSATAKHNAPAANTPAVVDQSRFKRFELALLGRFMRANKQEYPCKLNVISVGEASVNAPVEVELGERIVAYFDEIGGIEGSVVQVFEGGFAMALKATQHKRDKLAAQITWLINKDAMGSLPGRRHERVGMPNKSSTLKFPGGIAVDCRVLDVSLSGASIGTEARPAIGSEVTLGKLRCRVMRYHERGIGVQFLDIPDPEALRRYFG
jgi:PilZ domain